ncbi:amino acid permease [Candidatus Chrysopegis kryptomonas]|uniref:Amino acid/polyamine/organocation transporter, APC superfamily n=1 Tax=Candidatus Chryseopegocella kryptomonas TaxID=1633643 RepID=A0A0P1MYQ0_9BACT|nr:amino acid permease [Candidatus Chrysopegis kryptomonas]CUT01096.1 amino acid/polyamine/organocation transporter, APC superfamily [Candidatus Chrysopegis kryptomonas]
MSLFRKKSVNQILSEAESGENRLKRALNALDLTALGIGAIIGAGIFALTGTASAGGAHHIGAGPAIVISFIITAIACGFAALCYAELASMLPISGSAYTYSYAAFGEFIAWIIGWDLILEYAVGNIAVAISWSAYFVELLRGFGITIPAWLTTDYVRAINTPEILNSAPQITIPFLNKNIPIFFNLPAFGIVALITIVLVIGIRESSTFNAIMVAIKLVILLFFIIVGAFYVKPENWQPFAPNGWKGIMTGAALVFFAYIGFDAISTAAEETKNPQKNLPVGIIASLVITTILYIAVAIVLTGMIKYTELNVPEPLAKAFSSIGLNWAAGIVAFGAVVSTTAVLLVFQLGQPRIFFSMARDGLLPQWFAKVHPKFKTPHVTTILTGIFVAIPAAFADIGEAAELTNIGTLFAFVLTSGGVLVLRYTDPNAPRQFKTPLVPIVPILAILTCFYLMLSLPLITWIRFIVWLLIGFVIYFSYGYRHSKLRQLN